MVAGRGGKDHQSLTLHSHRQGYAAGKCRLGPRLPRPKKATFSDWELGRGMGGGIGDEEEAVKRCQGRAEKVKAREDIYNLSGFLII